MSRVKSKGNKSTETRLLLAFKSLGVSGWRRHSKILSYRPDFVFRKERVVVFTDGCFWHGCPLHGNRPKSNKEFWERKLDSNIARDIRANEELSMLGWKVLRFWEHAVRSNPESCAAEVVHILGRNLLSSRRALRMVP
jgi:DNA mismatch endonuclease (patch repair protein)